jgi:hypothetical protein
LDVKENNMIRTCNGCKALEMDRFNSRCTLNHKIVVVRSIMGFPVEFKPESGDCPKPKTNSVYCDLLLNMSKVK